MWGRFQMEKINSYGCWKSGSIIKPVFVPVLINSEFMQPPSLFHFFLFSFSLFFSLFFSSFLSLFFAFIYTPCPFHISCFLTHFLLSFIIHLFILSYFFRSSFPFPAFCFFPLFISYSSSLIHLSTAIVAFVNWLLKHLHQGNGQW